MDIRFLIVGTPFIIAFFYSLFWLKKWGAFDLSLKAKSNKIDYENFKFKEKYILESIFLIKN